METVVLLGLKLPEELVHSKDDFHVARMLVYMLAKGLSHATLQLCIWVSFHYICSDNQPIESAYAVCRGAPNLEALR